MDVVVRRLLVPVMVCIALAACSGGGGGGAAPAAPAAPGVGGVTTTPTPPPGGSTPTPTPRPSTSPTATPTASPTATASPTPSPNPSAAIAAACQQALTGTSSTISPTTTTAFLNTVVATGRKICMSAYVFTTVAFTALDTAAKNHATVVVVFPAEEQSYYQNDLNQLQVDGATIVIDPGAPSVNPIHAKLAIVDGNAYLDGHNWVEAVNGEPTDDVIIEDTIPADFTAIETALTSFANPPSSASGTLDLVKANSLSMEASFLQANLPSAGATVSYMTESFSSGASNVISALEDARANGATVNVILVGSDETSSADKSLIDTMQTDGITFYSNATTGSEKVLMISSLPGELWYGSSNSTSTSSLASDYIDWGMLITDTTTINAISAYYQAQLNAATPLAIPF